MNIIDIVILAILGFSVILGFYRGFLHTLLSVACCLLAVLVSLAFAPQLARALRGNQGVSSTLATYTDAVARVGDYDLATTDVNNLTPDVITRVLSSVSLPKEISDILKTNLSDKSFLGTGLNTVNDYVSSTVVAVAIDAICYVLVFAVAYLILAAVVSLIRHVFRLPILKQLDWLAGGVFGLLRGGMILYVLFLIIPVVRMVLPIGGFDEMLAASRIVPIFSNEGFFAAIISKMI